MVGGLLLSQALTLYTTPVIYIFFDRICAAFQPRAAARTDAGEPQTAERDEHLRPFIQRPVATTLLTVAHALAGAIAFKVLPVSPLPQVDFPTISVSASLPGGSPEIMASSIATPLERQFGHIAGITEMTSSSSLGSTNDHAAVRSEPQHRRRGARRGGGHQRCAHLPAGQPARQSHLSQGESR